MDPSQVASVTDRERLREARAGANWRCAYCNSESRAFDGSCAQCGSTAREGRPAVERRAKAPVRGSAATRRGVPIVALVVGLGGVLGLCGVGAVMARSARRVRPPPPAPMPAEPELRDVDAQVVAAQWKHQVVVERFSLVEREGFADQGPADASAVRPLGERQHHTEQVQQGTKTETYTETETETVQETYSEQEQCGESCTPVPQTCRERCTPNANGYATCRTECSGGGQSCSPKYCQVQKTRSVPRPKMVQKTRTAPNRVSVPRMAPYFAWKQWDWTRHRVVEEAGDGFSARWPTDQAVGLDAGLPKGEKERALRRADYTVDLRAADGTAHRVYPKTEPELASYRDASVTLRVWRHGGVEVVSGPRPAGDR
ncbi:MAG: hypothetical protein IT377_33345 [Polyangiaceae bacterium]|nr:hypothetical protein [Polyangiaceae bacterium]